MKNHETKKRSLMKTFTFRIAATILTIAVIFAFTKNFIFSIGIGFIDIVAKTALYYYHERIWDRINWERDD